MANQTLDRAFTSTTQAPSPKVKEEEEKGVRPVKAHSSDNPVRLAEIDVAEAINRLRVKGLMDHDVRGYGYNSYMGFSKTDEFQKHEEKGEAYQYKLPIRNQSIEGQQSDERKLILDELQGLLNSHHSVENLLKAMKSQRSNEGYSKSPLEVLLENYRKRHSDIYDTAEHKAKNKEEIQQEIGVDISAITDAKKTYKKNTPADKIRGAAVGTTAVAMTLGARPGLFLTMSAKEGTRMAALAGCKFFAGPAARIIFGSIVPGIGWLLLASEIIGTIRNFVPGKFNKTEDTWTTMAIKGIAPLFASMVKAL